MPRNRRDGYTIVAFVEVKKEIPAEEDYHASGTERGVVGSSSFSFFDWIETGVCPGRPAKSQPHHHRHANLTCSNSNLDDDGSTVVAFHDPSRCVIPDLDHSWFGTHKQVNFLNPNSTLTNFLSDGFVRVNDVAGQLDNGTETSTEDQTMGFYNQNDIPFY